VTGVTHSLFDCQNYEGRFLPGFEHHKKLALKESNNTDSSLGLTHFDHLTYAIPKNTSTELIKWYANIFNMKYFFPSLKVQTGESGMDLKAIKYWMCAETGVESNINSDFKFVIAEPFNDLDKKNQISIFLEEHQGPGIQHIGMHSSDIVQSVRQSKLLENEIIKYYVTPDHYYKESEKKAEISQCGLDVSLLHANHVLLDTELESEIIQNLKTTKVSTYLLQVFTQPIFEKNTLFLELIQRVGNANGFGANNIKALWNAVQLQILNNNNNKNKMNN
jgi:4-hydroxyphenylpyruvate dioxygenase